VFRLRLCNGQLSVKTGVYFILYNWRPRVKLLVGGGRKDDAAVEDRAARYGTRMGYTREYCCLL
jgi:hypothetical protein